MWDKRNPGDQPRRMLDTSKAGEYFSFKAGTSLEEGLMKTIQWYQDHLKSCEVIT